MTVKYIMYKVQDYDSAMLKTMLRSQLHMCEWRHFTTCGQYFHVHIISFSVDFLLKCLYQIRNVYGHVYVGYCINFACFVFIFIKDKYIYFVSWIFEVLLHTCAITLEATAPTITTPNHYLEKMSYRIPVSPAPTDPSAENIYQDKY